MRFRRRSARLRPVPPAHPREAAMQLLRDKLAASQAGLDPYDDTIFILQARDTETVWARRALELCGIVLDQTVEGRFRAILKPEVRRDLGLNSGARLMLDEPLASRRLEGEPQAGAATSGPRLVGAGTSASPSSHADALMDATLAALEQPRPAGVAALVEAKAAWDRREGRG